MTHVGPSGGHADPTPEQSPRNKRHANSSRSPRRRVRRIFGVTGTVLVTVLAVSAMLVAGARVSSRGMHEAVPTRQGQSVQHTAGNAAPASAGVTRHGRPIVVAIVAGTS